jgi:chromosome segregation protein
MYLSRVEIFGFKSFAQRTVVDFSSGVTCVVGPNGCGKTNILDAVRWVLGEQKSSTLRSDKMENVIFIGSRNRKGLGMAEVSITIQNSRNILPVEYSEILITRRLYRNGESEYLMNRAPCRLKDIQDLFMDTGMGPGSYSVIELKMIEDLLSEKPEERRVLFEEAAGISKYKTRRRAAERKLDETHNNILRLDDIASESERQVSVLKRQVRKTEKFRQYEDELRGTDLRLAKAEYVCYLEGLKPISGDLDKMRLQLATIDKDIAGSGARSTSLSKDVIKSESSLADAENLLGQRMKKFRKIQEEVLVSRERHMATKRDLERMHREQKELEPRIAQSTELVSQIDEKLLNSSERAANISENLQQAKEKTRTVSSKLDDIRAKAEKARSVVLETLSRFSQKSSEVARITAGMDNLSRQQKDLTEEASLARGDQKIRLSKIEEQNSAMQAKRKSVESAKLLYETTLENNKSIEEMQQELRRLRHELDSEQRSVNGRFKFLSNILSRFEGLPGGARLILEKKPAGIIDSVGNLLHAEKDILPAIEAAISESASWLVAENTDAINQAGKILNEAGKGSCTFVTLDCIPEVNADSKPAGIPQTCSPLASKVQLAERFRTLVEFLLENCWLCDTLDGLENAPVGHFFVTREGEWFRAPATHGRGQSSDADESHLGISFQLEQLGNTLADLEKQLAELGQQDAELKIKQQESLQKISLDKTELDGNSEGLLQTERQLNRLQYEEERYSRDEAGFKRSLVDIENRIKSDTAREKLLMAQLNDLQLERDDAESESHSLSRILEQLTVEFKQLAELQNQAQLKDSEFRMRQDADKQERARLKEFIEHSELNCERLKGESVAATVTIESLGKRVTELDRDLILVEEARSQDQKTLYHCKESLATLQGEQKDCNQAISDLQNKRTELSEVRHKLDLESSEMRIKLEALVRRVMDEYSEVLAELSDADEIASLRELDQADKRRRIVELRELIHKLGPVNLLAVEEYETQKERLDFLKTQLDDLRDSAAMLKKTIVRINHVASELFEETFSKIRINFEYLFKKLFSDGRANLELNGDPLEADISISVSPGGKRIQNLNLMSGGEKTLTAIALLFSIYMVKPSPFCILDEVDAPLDDANIAKFNTIIQEFAGMTQFIIITHNKKTMGYADRLYGVTMAEEGVSSLVSVRFN